METRDSLLALLPGVSAASHIQRLTVIWLLNRTLDLLFFAQVISRFAFAQAAEFSYAPLPLRPTAASVDPVLMNISPVEFKVQKERDYSRTAWRRELSFGFPYFIPGQLLPILLLV